MSGKKSPTKQIKVGSVLVVPVGKVASFLDSIKRRGVRLDKDIHRAAVSVVFHFKEHGNINLLTQLIDVMPKGQRTNALTKWFETYGGVSMDVDTKKLVKDHGKFDRIEESILKGAANPYYELKAMEGAPYKADADLESVIKYLIARSEKAEREGANEYHNKLNVAVTTLKAFKEATQQAA